jgi:hypothetical protein
MFVHIGVNRKNVSTKRSNGLYLDMQNRFFKMDKYHLVLPFKIHTGALLNRKQINPATAIEETSKNGSNDQTFSAF